MKIAKHEKLEEAQAIKIRQLNDKNVAATDMVIMERPKMIRKHCALLLY